MKLVLGFPQADKQTGVYVKEGFEELGHDVVAVNDPRVSPTSPQEILSLVDTHKPDFVFLAKDPRYNSVVEELASKVLTVMWNVDARYDIKIFLDTCGPLYKHCHLKFTIEQGNLDAYGQAGVSDIYWLSEGIAPKWHFKSGVPTTVDHIKYYCDVAFAGSITNIHEGREEVIRTIRQSSDAFDFVHFQGVFNLEHNKMCQAAAINLGHSGWPKVRLSMSARDYRVMGAGGFLLTNHVDGIEEWFEVGKMCDTYRTPAECVEKIKFYLDHPKLRKDIAQYGMEQMHLKHKFSDRLKIVVDKVKEYGS